MRWKDAVSVRAVDSSTAPVRFGCMGTCGKDYASSELKVSDGKAFCADCYPKPLPAKDVGAPHVRGPRPDWRKK